MQTQDTEQAENRLRESEARFRSLFETMVQGVVYQDSQGAIISANPAAERILGLTLDQMQGRTSIDPRWRALHEDGSYFPGETHPAMVALRTGQPVTDVVMGIYVPAEDHHRWININAVPQFKPGESTPYQVFTTLEDISGRRDAEAALQRNERILRLFVEHTPAAVAMLDRDMRYIVASRSYLKDYGLPAQAIIGRSHYELFPEIPERWKQIHRRCLFGAVEKAEEDPFLRADGSLDWVHWEIHPWYESEGVIGGIILFSEVITKRVQAQALLSAQRDLARAIGTFETVEAGFQAILATVLRLSGMDGGGIYLFSPDAKRLELIYHQGLGAEFIRAVESYPIDAPNARLALAGKPLYVSLADPMAQHPLYAAEGLRSLAAVPILYQDRVIGCFNLASHTEVEIPHFVRQAMETLAVEVGNFVAHLQSQEALRVGEEKFRQIADTINEVFWIFDNQQQKLVYLNPAYEKVWGISIAETYRDSRAYIQAIDPDDRPILFAALERQARGEQTEMEYRIVRPDGSVRWIFDRSFPILAADGQVLRTTGVATDITDRKQAYEALRESEERYRSLAEASDAIIVLLDADGRIHYMNERATVIKDAQGTPSWRVEDVLGKTLQDLAPPLADLYLLRVRQVIASNQSMVLESPAGANVYRVSIQPIHDEQGKAVLALLSATDITALKQTQQELHELNRVLEERVAQRTAEVQDLYDNAPTGYHSLDANGCFLRINQTELRWLGYTREELIGRPVAEILTPVTQAVHQVNLPRLKQYGLLRDVEIELVRKDGSILPMLLNATAVYDEHGNFVASRSTLVDNTERKRAEQALRASEETLRLANAEMARALRMKDEFLANMSHELRTPLHGILAMTETLLDQIRGPLNEHQQKSVGLIEQSGRHLLALINDLLDLSKIEAGKLELHFESLLVDDICQASLQFVRTMALKKEIRVEYANPSPGARLSADEQRLKQMLVNLLSNAVKFTPSGGRVDLGVTVEPGVGLIHFVVQDNGPGIALADQPLLFQPFVQVDAQLSRQYEGTGLGLALVKRLAEQHHGLVRLDSTGIPGEGCRFTITLPYTPATPTVTTDAAQPNLAVASGAAIPDSGPLLLLVEDNEVNITAVEEYMRHAGYQVAVARSGTEALELAAAITPDLILMDVQLPLLDGLEVTRRLRAQPRFATTPIIAVTASAMTGDRERCLAAGATGYLSKPLRLKELLAMVMDLTAPHAL